MINQWRKQWVEKRANRVYSKCLFADGETAEGVHWRDQESQQLRFDELIKIIEPNDELKLIDWGCGYGALFDYIKNKPWMTSAHYVGLDINENMIEACRRRIMNKHVEFSIANRPSTQCDYLLASGTWNFKMHESRAFWWSIVKTEIKNAWQYVDRGMAFNLLSIAPKSQFLFWMDPETIERFVRREITENARIKPIWGLPDLSISMWK